MSSQTSPLKSQAYKTTCLVSMLHNISPLRIATYWPSCDHPSAFKRLNNSQLHYQNATTKYIQLSGFSPPIYKTKMLPLTCIVQSPTKATSSTILLAISSPGFSAISHSAKCRCNFIQPSATTELSFCITLVLPEVLGGVLSLTDADIHCASVFR